MLCTHVYHQLTSNISRQWNWCSRRRSSSIAYRRYFNNIFILNWTPGFNGLYKDDCQTRQETFRFYDLVRLALEVCFMAFLSVLCLCCTNEPQKDVLSYYHTHQSHVTRINNFSILFLYMWAKISPIMIYLAVIVICKSYLCTPV